jgi:hypothetical protein
MTSFVSAMNLMKQGVNGSTVFTEDAIDPRVVLFTSAIRDSDFHFIKETLWKFIGNSNELELDGWLLAFQIRDIRGGKGERDVFYKMLKVLLDSATSDMGEKMIRLIPEYGSWLDIMNMLEFPKHHDCRPLDHHRASMKRLVGEQLEKDEKVVASVAADAATKPGISLLAKWMPRESGASRELAWELAGIENGKTKKKECNWLLMKYRKRIVALNKYLETTEIDMCGRTWAKIKPDHVPGILMNKCRLAFLNELKANARFKDGIYVGKERYDSEDRRECAEHFKEYAAKAAKGEVKAKGAQTVYPHNVTTKIGARGLSDDEKNILEGQWLAIREKAAAAGSLKRTVVLSDVSGSMNGTPMDVSVALGILISELNDSAFKDHIMTFESNPKWVSLGDCADLKAKVEKVRSAPWGGSTNFEKAMKLILSTMVAASVPVEEQPTDLLVLTDMGFDEASRGSGFHIENIKRDWAAAGYQVPRIIIWNLRAEYKEYHAKETTPGVVTLSGWSPSALKVLQNGKVEVQNMMETIRATLDDARYDAVRRAYESSSK